MCAAILKTCVYWNAHHPKTSDYAKAAMMDNITARLQNEYREGRQTFVHVRHCLKRFGCVREQVRQKWTNENDVAHGRYRRKCAGPRRACRIRTASPLLNCTHSPRRDDRGPDRRPSSNATPNAPI